MALRLATPADEAKILNVCANTAWPEQLPEMVGEWDHTAYLALFARKENIVVVSDNLGIDGVAAFSVTITDYVSTKDGAVPVHSARITCPPMVAKTVVDRTKLAAQLLDEGLRLCALQGATGTLIAFNPGPLTTALKSLNLTLVDATTGDKPYAVGSEPLADVRTKLAVAVAVV